MTNRLPIGRIICGDAYELIRDIPADSMDLVITSPPYFQQRDYGGGIGDEPSVEEYVANLTALFRECVRAIKPTGSVVFNVGDKYVKGSIGDQCVNGNLSLAPYRFAIAASELGVAKLVNQVTWVKQNPTPRQFKRRLVSSAEPFFHFVKTDDYHFDIDAFLRRHDHKAKARKVSNVGQSYFERIDESDLTDEQKRQARAALIEAIQEVKDGKIADIRMKIKGVHAEAFGGQAGGRQIQLQKNGFTIIRLKGERLKRDVIESPVETVKGSIHPAIYPAQVIVEFLRLLTPPKGIVLDPFMGSGSTAVACKMTDRQCIGFELNADYCEEARRRAAEAEEALRLF